MKCSQEYAELTRAFKCNLHEKSDKPNEGQAVVILVRSWLQPTARRKGSIYLTVIRLTYRYTEHCLTRSSWRVQGTPPLTDISSFEHSNDNKK